MVWVATQRVLKLPTKKKLSPAQMSATIATQNPDTAQIASAPLPMANAWRTLANWGCAQPEVVAAQDLRPRLAKATLASVINMPALIGIAVPNRKRYAQVIGGADPFVDPVSAMSHKVLMSLAL